MLVIFGCGGHARSLAEVALFNGLNNLIFVDEGAGINEKLFGFDVLRALPEHFKNEEISVITAIGDNQKRFTLFEAIKHSHHCTSLISRDAYLGKDAHIAPGVFVGHSAYLGPNVSIGENTIINTHSLIEHDSIIGKHSHISIKANIAGKCSLSDFVMVGASATIIDGINICSNVIIGAGAVVVNDINEPGTYVGIPARKIKDYNEN